ncbi:MAG: hypothetical protein QGH85_02260 [Candidatus Pacebacteria bacterium]|jgi:hypothetical protein|nr:hypothetical protein [Parcubacteria group bacterium]MDP6249570.1 hypothetical protein [Candidatus Paceibacterota bacterium]MDP7159006.1 hypothetical protein [Candidatus Paceibacterota bacterium]MDP7366558.1 hypothetical protein [Candidatus Paceibacterota bacterium]MDP7466420.1 hypothetical protein [Candidatus Paceibacterota bacterium]|tara:strand:- start:20466 stop:20963 length:498 start_codon:yes stop_codon:yes gene_type:complete
MFTTSVLGSLLTSFEISVDRFGKGIEDLFNEINNGDCELIILGSNIYYGISMVRIFVFHNNSTVHISVDGQEKKNYLIEKIYYHENPKIALHRVFTEKLNIHSSLNYHNHYEDEGTKIETYDSTDYPGLEVKSTIYEIAVILTQKQFKELEKSKYIKEELVSNID